MAGRLAAFGPESLIAGLAIVGIAIHLWLRWGTDTSPFIHLLPLYVVLVAGAHRWCSSLR